MDIQVKKQNRNDNYYIVVNGVRLEGLISNIKTAHHFRKMLKQANEIITTKIKKELEVIDSNLFNALEKHYNQ